MNTTYIILIIVVVCLICLSSAAFIFYKKKNEKEILIYNNNIDDYNTNYNLNYENGKLYYQNDFKNMHKSMAKVLTNSKTKTITVNNTDIKIYVSTIEYEIINYMNHNIGKLVTKDNSKATLNKESETIIEKPIVVTADIITTIPLEKGIMFSVYYNYDKDRTAPPFLPEKYVTYLQKK